MRRHVRSLLQSLLVSLFFAIAVGTLIAIVVSFLALEHNAQGVFCDFEHPGWYSTAGTPCTILWKSLATQMFSPWLALVAGPFFLIASAVCVLRFLIDAVVKSDSKERVRK